MLTSTKTLLRNIISLVFLALFATLVPITNAAPSSEDLKARALEVVAKRVDASPNNLAVMNLATVEYPLQNKTAFAFKIMNKLNSEIVNVILNNEGRELDTAQMEANEQRAYIAKYGKLDPALAEYLSKSTEDSYVDVIIWLNEPQYVEIDRPTPMIMPDVSVLTDDQANTNIRDNLTPEERLAIEERTNAFYSQADTQQAAMVERIVNPVVDKLSRLGNVTKIDKYTPILYAYLTPKTIREVAGWNEVNAVYLSLQVEQTLDVARSTIGADIVNNRGITGFGVKVAQLEVGHDGRGVVVALNNPYLSGVIQNYLYACSSPDYHGTAIAGIIRSTHTTVRGIAPQVSLWTGGSCRADYAEMANRSSYAADWGAQVLNLSFGGNQFTTPTPWDRFYDTMVLYRSRTIVASAGNEAGCNGGTGIITFPGRGYNVITVGNFDDKNTISWFGDTMGPCSSWVDPSSTYNDREKPEVVAPGTNIRSTTTAWPWINTLWSQSGTSFAAPMVTGVAALLIQRNPSLATFPEALKAILMVTAVHNIEGSTRLSERDGSGGIVAGLADNVARGVSGNWGEIFYPCNTAFSRDVATPYLTAGVRTRAVIVWDTNPNYSSYASRPSADLDFAVVDPTGNWVASSVSWDNTYEIVDFRPATSGYYKLRVIKVSCDLDPYWLGFAWVRGNF